MQDNKHGFQRDCGNSGVALFLITRGPLKVYRATQLLYFIIILLID